MTPRSGLARLTRHFPPGQFARYLVVGVWNTLFGYSTYAALTALFQPHMRYGYMAAAVLSSIPNITVAFLGYKWFVFRTKGNYLREWGRCFAVYGSNLLLGLMLLPLTVYAFRLLGMGWGAPYAAGAFQRIFGIMYSFVGHKKYSFRRNDELPVSMDRESQAAR
jgi:putative flippase GtrA